MLPKHMCDETLHSLPHLLTARTPRNPCLGSGCRDAPGVGRMPEYALGYAVLSIAGRSMLTIKHAFKTGSTSSSS